MTISAHTIGSKFDETLTIVEVCKLLRKELKSEGYVAKVRKTDYASISVQVKPLEGAVQNENGHYFQQWQDVRAIVNRFNYDNSRIEVDYFEQFFHASVSIRETFY